MKQADKPSHTEKRVLGIPAAPGHHHSRQSHQDDRPTTGAGERARGGERIYDPGCKRRTDRERETQVEAFVRPRVRPFETETSSLSPREIWLAQG